MSIVCSNVTCATFAPVPSCAHEPTPRNISSPDLFLHITLLSRCWRRWCEAKHRRDCRHGRANCAQEEEIRQRGLARYTWKVIAILTDWRELFCKDTEVMIYFFLGRKPGPAQGLFWGAVSMHSNIWASGQCVAFEMSLKSWIEVQKCRQVNLRSIVNHQAEEYMFNISYPLWSGPGGWELGLFFLHCNCGISCKPLPFPCTGHMRILTFRETLFLSEDDQLCTLWPPCRWSGVRCAWHPLLSCCRWWCWSYN